MTSAKNGFIGMGVREAILESMMKLLASKEVDTVRIV